MDTPLNLKSHPEACNSGNRYFNYDNRIPQETVPRGDRRVPYQGPYDLTEGDFLGLAEFAKNLVNKDLARYDQRVACQEALDLAIRDKDNGRFDGKLNANTYQMILSYIMGGGENGPEASEKESSKKSPKKETKETKAPKETVTLQKVRYPGRGVEVSKDELRKVLQGRPSRELTIHKKRELGIKASQEETMSKYASVTASLDKVASALEGSNDPDLLHIAYQVDKVSDELEALSKSAAALESEKDEGYMKTHFKDGVVDGDQSDPDLKNFNVDKSLEVERVKTEKGPVRKAASFPYQKV